MNKVVISIWWLRICNGIKLTQGWKFSPDCRGNTAGAWVFGYLRRPYCNGKRAARLKVPNVVSLLKKSNHFYTRLINYILSSFLVIFSLQFTVAQDEYVVEDFLRYNDFVYNNNIKSVRLFPLDNPTYYPVIELNTNQALRLVFDDLSGGFTNFSYKLLHFNHKWELSDLQPYDYIDGFTEANIFNYEYAYNNNIDYTHYQLILPNNEMSITKSGNYLLLVYQNDNPTKPIITKHFYVVEPVVSVKGPANAFMLNNFFIDFIVDAKQIYSPNPYNEFKVNIVQNGILAQSVTGLICNFVSNGELTFNNIRKGRLNPSESYRYFDMRSFKFNSKRIEAIEKSGPKINVVLKTDELSNTNFNNFNLAGNYYVDILSTFNDELQANYAKVNFSFYADAPFENANVYATGGFCNFMCNRQNSMAYNYDTQQYEGSYLLKQGFYNYTYCLIDDDTQQIQPLSNSRAFNEFNNNFQILVYYTPFGERYDRLIGYETFNSNF